VEGLKGHKVDFGGELNPGGKDNHGVGFSFLLLWSEGRPWLSRPWLQYSAEQVNSTKKYFNFLASEIIEWSPGQPQPIRGRGKEGVPQTLGTHSIQVSN
jgi:hypothetical protein